MDVPEKYRIRTVITAIVSGKLGAISHVFHSSACIGPVLLSLGDAAIAALGQGIKVIQDINRAVACWCELG